MCVCVYEKVRERGNEREINVPASGKYQVSKNVNIINQKTLCVCVCVERERER